MKGPARVAPAVHAIQTDTPLTFTGSSNINVPGRDLDRVFSSSDDVTLREMIGTALGCIKSSSKLLQDRFGNPPEELPRVTDSLTKTDDLYPLSSHALTDITAHARFIEQQAAALEHDLRAGSDLVDVLMRYWLVQCELDQAM